jgi:thioredoxin-related protein
MSYFLENLANVPDVRDYINEVVHMNQINYERAKEILAKIDGLDRSRSGSLSAKW